MRSRCGSLKEAADHDPGERDLALADRSLIDTLAVAAAARGREEETLARVLDHAGPIAMLAHLIESGVAAAILDGADGLASITDDGVRRADAPEANSESTARHDGRRRGSPQRQHRGRVAAHRRPAGEPPIPADLAEMVDRHAHGSFLDRDADPAEASARACRGLDDSLRGRTRTRRHRAAADAVRRAASQPGCLERQDQRTMTSSASATSSSNPSQPWLYVSCGQRPRRRLRSNPPAIAARPAARAACTAEAPPTSRGPARSSPVA